MMGELTDRLNNNEGISEYNGTITGVEIWKMFQKALNEPPQKPMIYFNPIVCCMNDLEFEMWCKRNNEVLCSPKQYKYVTDRMKKLGIKLPISKEPLKKYGA